MTDALRLIDHPMVAALGWTLTHFVWQGAVLGLIAFFILRVVRPAEASTRYLVGVATLAAMLIVPVATFLAASGEGASWQRPWRTSTAPAAAGAGMVTGSIVLEAPDNPIAARPWMSSDGAVSEEAAPVAPLWLPIVTALWMAGVAGLSLRMAGGWVLAQLLAHRGVAAISADVEAAARAVARRLQLRRSVSVRQSAIVRVPTLVGWFKPVILLPASVLSGLSREQLEAVIAHELAHVRRHDYLVNLLQSAIETLLFYHPAVWWVSSEVRAEREHCCDDLAVEVCGDRLIYVSALAELTSIERRAFALAATDGSLLTRVRRILGRPADTRRELPPSWGVLVLLILVGGGAGTYEMTTAAADVERIAQAAAIESDGVNQARWFERVMPVVPEPPAPPAPPAPSAPAAPVAPVAPVAPAAPAAPVAPVAPSAPVAPVAPSAPPPPALSFSTQRGEGTFTWSNNGDRLTVKWTGPFRLSDDERDISWIEEGARVTIADGWVFTDRIELRGLAGGQVERKFYRSGLERAFDDEARAFLASAVQFMIRAGMLADERVARFLKEGGPDAVLAAIDRMQTESSHTLRRYYSALLEQAKLTPAQLTSVLERVARDIRSDHEKGTVLRQALKQASIDDEQRVLVVRAARGIGSDHEQRRVLTEAIAAATLAPAVALATIETAAASIDSAHEKRQVLTALAARPALPEAVVVEALRAAADIGSAHEQRQVVTAYLARGDASPEIAAAALASAGGISSSHEKSRVLRDVIAKGGVTEATAPSFFAAAKTIGSSNELARVLTALVTRGPLSDPLLAGLLDASRAIGSSHELSKLLLTVLKTHDISSAMRDRFLEAADRISSSHEQNQVLAALVRAERQ